MIPSPDTLRRRLLAALDAREAQGREPGDLRAQIDTAPDVEALAQLAQRLDTLPLRRDWPYLEPDDLRDIWAECEPDRTAQRMRARADDELAAHARTAFLASVCGCTLGKPLEVEATHAELRAALQASGEWPLRDYVAEPTLDALGRRSPDWQVAVRGRIAGVPLDDDINYRIVGLLLLERHGTSFTHADLRRTWLDNLPVHATFGPERSRLLLEGLRSLDDDATAWSAVPDPCEEWCGALIRADAYGWALPGRPTLAAELAWRDASFTHRATGVYAAMFVAAALAAAPLVTEPLDMVEVGLGVVPRRSRLHETLSVALREVRSAGDWLDGCARIHTHFGEFGHCRVHQEIGTLVNTLRFARDAGEGICMQVMQGNDTDSFGATAGSLLGAFYGPSGLEQRWLEPFSDRLHVAMASFSEQSLARVADRVAALPARFRS